MSELIDIFNGRLPGLLENYVAREAQQGFAEAVESIISEKGHGLIEAGTGIGKTIGYLIPILASDSTAIVSTGTRNLQDQIFLKDLPVVASLFPNKRFSILKGRANYLCSLRMRTNLKVVGKGAVFDHLMEIRSWSSLTKTGDLTELLDPEDHPETMRLVTSTKDNCLGSRCPDFDQCAVYRARAKVSQSDLVVVNHHLLFADLAQREDALQYLLPNAGVILVDEAHRVTDVARQFFGQQLSSSHLVELVKDLNTEILLLGDDDPVTSRVVDLLEIALKNLKRDILESEEVNFESWRKQSSVDSLFAIDHALNGLINRLDLVSERSTALQQSQKRALRLADLFAMLTEEIANGGEYVHWIERRANSFSICLSPVSIAGSMRDVTSQSDASWIFTSATLSMNNGFDYFKSSWGLELAETQSFTSPFNYRDSVRGWLPSGLPDPGGEAHTSALVDAVKPLIIENEGHTFFLFTSYRAMKQAARLLSDVDKTLLVQGSISRSQLSKAFTEQPGSILLATQSFWEGVDFKGADLHLLIIDKLPFPNPADPIYEAEARRLSTEGGNSFVELALPRMIFSLRQGFGRLIRQESDRGLFVLGDSRLLKREYGHFVLGNLPDIQWLESLEDASTWLRTL